MVKTVVIDPGHHNLDKNKGQTGYYEYAGMWKLSNYLKSELIRCGIDVKLTRTESQNPTLTNRGYGVSNCTLFRQIFTKFLRNIFFK